MSTGTGPAVLSPSASRLSTWAELRLGAQPWTPPLRRTLVVAPHPDDEVLGAGGIICRQAVAGVDVTVLAVTDGDASYPSVDRMKLAELRRVEQESALGELSPTPPSVQRLGIPDGQVGEHERDLTKALESMLRPDDLIVAPWARDHHCDHEAVGRAAATAALTVGCILVSSLFWAWQHTDPDFVAPLSLNRIDLTPDELRRRSTAMQRHRSQITDLIAQPILVESDLVPLQWDAEFYLVQP